VNAQPLRERRRHCRFVTCYAHASEHADTLMHEDGDIVNRGLPASIAAAEMTGHALPPRTIAV
jgi:hypothetical protein